jgi:thiamine biosynthesis lipoprotein
MDDKGRKVGHTINPVTGYPTNHNLLSCTVIAKNGLTADAFATAFMVVGLDSAMHWIEKFPRMEACFIYDDNGLMKTLYTQGLKKHIIDMEKEQAD